MGIITKTARLAKGLLNVKKRRYRHLAQEGKVVTYTLPTGFSFSLYPRGQIAELLYTMSFEFDLLSLVATYLQPGMNVVDVGANCGAYAVIAGKKIGPEGGVWAFEPAADSIGRLKANMGANAITSYEAERLALSDSGDGFLELVNEEGQGDGYRYLKNNQSSSRKPEEVLIGEKETVPVTTLDAYAKKVGLPPVHFLKVDVEGGEFGVFNGARQFLADNKDLVILFESAPIGLARAGHSQDELHKLIISLGYALYAWDAKQGGWTTDEDLIRNIGNVWAARNKKLLPSLS
jgi:FkbM family methyltransferase